MPDLPDSHKPHIVGISHHWPNDTWGKGRGGRRWQAKREWIFKRDKYQCQECKRNDIETYVELHGKYHGICDHIRPISLGGDDREANLETLCQSCSKKKTQAESRQGRGGWQ